jgi:hypothetical protein
MKLVPKALIGVTAVLLAFLLVPGPISAQKTKNSSTELGADFRDASGDKIHGNGTGPFYSNNDTSGYPNDVVLAPNGSLYMRIQKTQRVFFDFDTPLRNWLDENGEITCRAYSTDGRSGTVFSYPGPTPAFLPGRPDNDFTLIVTGGGYTENNGQWSFSSTYVNLKTIPVGEVAYVAMSFRFDIPEESFFMFFGSRIWTPDYAKPANGWTGIVQVTRDSGTSWYIEPLPVDHPIALARGLQADQTSLFTLGSTGKGNKSLSGNCDLGDWRMPFGLSLWVR